MVESRRDEGYSGPPLCLEVLRLSLITFIEPFVYPVGLPDHRHAYA